MITDNLLSFRCNRLQDILQGRRICILTRILFVFFLFQFESFEKCCTCLIIDHLSNLHTRYYFLFAQVGFSSCYNRLHRQFWPCSKIPDPAVRGILASAAGGQFIERKPRTGNESLNKWKEKCVNILEQILHLQKEVIKITRPASEFGSCGKLKIKMCQNIRTDSTLAKSRYYNNKAFINILKLWSEKWYDW